MDSGFCPKVQNAIRKSKVLVVGAGGIGCEILNNLILTGFSDIEIIDLDRIGVNYIYRQFDFKKKQHIDKSKSVLSFKNKGNIIHHHVSNSIFYTIEYGLSFFKRFSLVMNTLDNRTARNHVNRICLAADVPLIECGTAGYEGRLKLIKKGYNQCYECMPKEAQKTFPSFTILNAPSEPIHCIVWATNLFNQLFGKEDPDQDVSPDTTDPEAAEALQSDANEDGNVDRVSMRCWAQFYGYDPEKLFSKLFHDDIKYFLSIGNQWKKRRSLNPLEYNNLLEGGCNEDADLGLKDQQLWSIARCVKVFAESVKNLSKTLVQIRGKNPLVHLNLNRYDQDAMDFVAACANIRAYIFGIAQRSRSDIESMAVNIISAIEATNSIIGGVVVLHAIIILLDDLEFCESIYFRQEIDHQFVNSSKLVPEKSVNPPNPKCYVSVPAPQSCLASEKTEMLTISEELRDSVTIAGQNMITPDTIIDGKGTIDICSREDEIDENNDNILKTSEIIDGTIHQIDDFSQNVSFTVTVKHGGKPESDSNNPEFLIIADDNNLLPKEKRDEEITYYKNKKVDDDKADIIMEEVIENNIVPVVVRKRKASESEIENSRPSKKSSLENPYDDEDGDNENHEIEFNYVGDSEDDDLETNHCNQKRKASESEIENSRLSKKSSLENPYDDEDGDNENHEIEFNYVGDSEDDDLETNHCNQEEKEEEMIPENHIVENHIVPAVALTGKTSETEVDIRTVSKNQRFLLKNDGLKPCQSSNLHQKIQPHNQEDQYECLPPQEECKFCDKSLPSEKMAKHLEEMHISIFVQKYNRTFSSGSRCFSFLWERILNSGSHYLFLEKECPLCKYKFVKKDAYKKHVVPKKDSFKIECCDIQIDLSRNITKIPEVARKRETSENRKKIVRHIQKSRFKTNNVPRDDDVYDKGKYDNKENDTKKLKERPPRQKTCQLCDRSLPPEKLAGHLRRTHLTLFVIKYDRIFNTISDCLSFLWNEFINSEKREECPLCKHKFRNITACRKHITPKKDTNEVECCGIQVGYT